MKKNGEFNEPNLKQKYDFDLTCKKFIESSYVLEVLQNITPKRMLGLIKNNEKYKDFLSNLNVENENGVISVISDKTKNSHFNILQNTDVLGVIDKSIIEENVSQSFLSKGIKDFNFTSQDKVNEMYKYLIKEMDINIEDKDINTYFNENDEHKEKFITEVKLENFDIDNFIRLETSPLDGIKKVSQNVNKVDDAILKEATLEEMLDNESSTIYQSIKKLYDYVFGENYFTNEDEFKKEVKNDFKYDYLTINDDIKTNETYLWYIDTVGRSYAVQALDSTKPVFEGEVVSMLFGVKPEKKASKSSEEEM